MRGEAIEEDTVLLDEEAYLNIPTCGKGSQKEVQEDVERVEHGVTLKVHNPGIDKAQTIVTTPGTVVQIVPFGGDGRATAGESPRRSGGAWDRFECPVLSVFGRINSLFGGAGNWIVEKAVTRVQIVISEGG